MQTTTSKSKPSRGKGSISSSKRLSHTGTHVSTSRQASSAMEFSPGVVESVSSITIDNEEHPLYEIRATGDAILDVTFETTLACDKSIEGSRVMERMKEEAAKTKTPPQPIRRFYRVRIDTLKKNSKYFGHLLGSDVFGEGINVKTHLKRLVESGNDPTNASAELLPRLEIQDDEDSTLTYGRDKVFEDMLRIVHGQRHLTDSKNIGLHYLSVLVTLADKYECMGPISRYLSTEPLSRYKYPANTTEEIIRKKLLIFYLANLAPMQANATFESCSRELIVRGSIRWDSPDDGTDHSTARWWNLPGGLEDELAYRRKCILTTIASLQNHYLNLYTSKTRQCVLGYDSSPACDSFQLGEMIKFLTNKKLLTLSTFSGIGPYDSEYVWPEAYSGNIEGLVSILHQVPSYQIDKFHGHCGLRSRILPPLDFIKQCISQGAAINSMRWQKDRDGQTWVPLASGCISSTPRKPFEVGDKAVGEQKRNFVFVKKEEVPSMGTGLLGIERAAKHMFTADEWDWSDNQEIGLRNSNGVFSLNFK